MVSIVVLWCVLKIRQWPDIIDIFLHLFMTIKERKQYRNKVFSVLYLHKKIKIFPNMHRKQSCRFFFQIQLTYSDALEYSPCSSKYSIRRFKKLSWLTVSVSHTRQHCLLARVTATFIRLWSLKNPTWKHGKWYHVTECSFLLASTIEQDGR